MGRNIHTKVFQKPCKELVEVLSKEEKAVLFDLIPRIPKDMLAVSDDNGEPMILKQIAKLLGYSDRNFRRILNGLAEKGILQLEEFTEKTKVVVMNREYFLNGY